MSSMARSTVLTGLRGATPSRQAFLRTAFTVAPILFGLLVAAWLGSIIANLLLIGGYDDIALRDFGLLVAALALSRLAVAEDARGCGRGM